MELVKLNLNVLHKLESGQFIVRFFSDFLGTGLSANTDPQFEAIYLDLQTQSGIYNLALAQMVAQEESNRLLELDHKRDKKVSALRSAWNAFKSYDDGSPKKLAYNKLILIMNNYKNITTENYEAESLGLTNFIAGLRNTENFPAVQLLNMEEHLNNLDAANNLFTALFDVRSNTAVSTVNYNNRELKIAIFATYKELTGYVLTMSKRRNTDNQFYITILGAINNGRTYYANIIANRGGGGNNTPPAAPTA
jgi:hypothetical protein